MHYLRVNVDITFNMIQQFHAIGIMIYKFVNKQHNVSNWLLSITRFVKNWVLIVITMLHLIHVLMLDGYYVNKEIKNNVRWAMIVIGQIIYVYQHILIVKTSNLKMNAMWIHISILVNGIQQMQNVWDIMKEIHIYPNTCVNLFQRNGSLRIIHVK